MSVPQAQSGGEGVRGEDFYGRRHELDEILDGPRDGSWLVGTRRIGKTSVLLQLEQLAERVPERGYLPLYWDLQGAADVSELHLDFLETLEGAGERLTAAGVEREGLAGEDLFATLRLLRRRVRKSGRRLLLLCDEAEALIELQRRDPSVLRRLRRALRSGEDVRTVLASTIRLWELAEERADTSPFLHGFTPPIFLGPLRDAAARSLVVADQRPSGPRPIDQPAADEICRRCANHPFLLELAARRFVELGDVGAACAAAGEDDRSREMFAVDFEMLDDGERRLLLALAGPQPAPSSEPSSESASRSTSELASALGLESDALPPLQRLERLGLVRREEERRYSVASEPFRGWLQGLANGAPGESRLRSLLGARLTEMLSSVGDAEAPPRAPAELLERVYDELRELAGRYMSRERRGHTLQPTALVHEAYLRLVDQQRVSWQGRTHFLAMGAEMMRRVLVDHARGRNRIKRGGELQRVTLTDWLPAAADLGLGPAQLLDLDQALERLASESERRARVVELRYFGGLKVAEIATVLGVSKRTVEGDWAQARDWLRRELGGGQEE